MARLVRTYMLLPALLMLFIVFYPFAANLFYTNTEIMDNRPLHEKPVKFTRNYAREFEDYYNDTFAGRKKIISKYVKLQKKLKIDAGQYFYGQDGWVFYDSIKANNGNTLVDYYAEVYFDDEELEKMAQGINMAYDFYAKRGIKYVIFVAPNKENIYSEFMPERMRRIRKSDVSRMDKAVEYLKKHTKAEIVNAKPAMVKAKSMVAQNLYFKKDTHWNEVGAYVAFEKLSETLSLDGIRGIPRKPLRKEMIGLKGFYSSDLNRLGGDEDISYSVDFLSGKEGKAVVSLDNRFFEVWENPKAPVKKTVLMIRDSFGLALMPYLDKTFAKNVFAHNRYNKRHELDRLVDEYKPDIMIEEMVERYFDRLLKYNELYGE